jgi:hypothetical protein
MRLKDQLDSDLRRVVNLHQAALFLRLVVGNAYPLKGQHPEIAIDQGGDLVLRPRCPDYPFLACCVQLAAPSRNSVPGSELGATWS